MTLENAAAKADGFPPPDAARRLGPVRDWIAIAVMLSSAGCLALIFTATGPVLPLIARHFSQLGRPVFTILGMPVDGPFFAQLIATTPSIGLILGGGPTGWAIDRMGVRNVLLGALCAFALFGSAGLYIQDPGWLLASRLALGFAAIALASSTVWLIGARFDDAGRARALSWRNLFGGVAGAVSTLGAGRIAEAFGWQGVFAFFLVPLVIVPAAAVAIPSTGPRRPRSTTAVATESVLFLWPIFLLVMALAVVMMMNTAQLSFLLVENGVTSPSTLSNVMVVGSLASMAGSVLYSMVGPKLGMRGNYTLLAALLGSGVAVVGLSHGPMVAAIGAGLTGLGAGCLAPHFSRIVLGRAPPAARGRAIGLNFSALYLGDLLNPFVIRPIAIALGIHTAFVLIGSVVALSGLQIFAPARSRPGAPSPARSSRS